MKTPDQIFYDNKSSKAELRQALGETLGIQLPNATSPNDTSTSVFKQCLTIFCTAYEKQTGVKYAFGPRDGISLKSIITKIESIEKGSEENLATIFEVLIAKTPDWYRQNNFTLPAINTGFNNIVTHIKSNNHGRISNDYKEKILRDLQS